MRARFLLLALSLVAGPAFAQTTPPPPPAPAPEAPAPAPSEQPATPPAPTPEPDTPAPTAPAPGTPAPAPTGQPTTSPAAPPAQPPTQPPPASPPAQPTTQPPPPPPPPPPSAAASSAGSDRWYFGGWVGASFGDIEYVELAPLVGYRLTPRISTGLSLFYRWKSDDRYEQSFDTNDWGGSLFGRVKLFRRLYLAAEYEYGEYEYVTPTGPQTYGTETFSDTNVLGGAGISVGAGRTGLYFEALYNFSYDDNDPYEPYDSPWIYRAGVSFGF